MKAELIHLLAELQGPRALEEGFQSFEIFKNGTCSALYRQRTLRFQSLEQLEEWLYRPNRERDVQQEGTEKAKEARP